MDILAHVHNTASSHSVTLSTNGNAHAITIAPKSAGRGSSANGGELLFLALASCYCNDVFREAAKQDVLIEDIEVTVKGKFGGVGEPAREVTYATKVKVKTGDEEKIRRLLKHTDTVSEIQNSLRQGVAVELSGIEIEWIT